MVKSQIVSITPATHGASHRHGGVDPLTGDVRIDGLGWTLNGTEVVAANLVNSVWTEIDLSAIVGANQALVMLRLNNHAAAACDVGFRRAGDTDLHYDVNGTAVNSVHMQAHADAACYGICITSATGKLEYFSGALRNASIDLVAWQLAV